MTGKTISHYKILEEIGRGGMGEVYLALDMDLERQVAIKFLPKELTKDDENVERFKREAKSAASLNHPNIITIYEIGMSDDEYFIVMEYVQGETLREKLDRERQLAFREINDILKQVCTGLEKAHEAGIVHRDIKPENIFINEDGRVKILDFGLAKLRGSSKLTKDLSTLGTIRYISPEQARGEETSARSDIWSTGIILYEMITGITPFKGDYEQAVIYGILNEEPRRPEEIRKDIPLELIHIINQSLQKIPEQRYQSMSALLSDINPLQKNKKTVKQSKSIPSKFTYLSIVFIIIISVAVYLYLNTKHFDLNQVMSQVTPFIERDDYDGAYDYLVNSGIEVGDLEDNKLYNKIVGALSIDSKPQNVDISLSRIRHKPKLHLDPDSFLGETPLVNHPFFAGEYFLQLFLSESKSFRFIIELIPNDTLYISRSLEPKYFSEEDMILIETGKNFKGEPVPSFYIDINEVTNRDYFNFVSAGGYRLSHLWPEKMIIKNHIVPQEQALKVFVDQTGISAPRHWSGGKYPQGTENYPVTGVTWYEANAYAIWAGKQLPIWKQWWRAAVGTDGRIFPWGNDVSTISERANFGAVSLRQVGSFPLGLSYFGCLDMAGNVTEWLRDSNGIENPARTVGGSWQNPSYMFEPIHASPFQRDYSSIDIGFRCVKEIEGE
jgi:serine/threonine protein kinase